MEHPDRHFTWESGQFRADDLIIEVERVPLLVTVATFRPRPLAHALEGGTVKQLVAQIAARARLRYLECPLELIVVRIPREDRITLAHHPPSLLLCTLRRSDRVL